MAGTKGRSGRKAVYHPPKTNKAGNRPKMPTGLTAEQKKYWRSILKDLPGSDLAKIDVHQLKSLVILLAKADELAAKETESAYRLYLATIKEIHKLSTVFGLNPADRQRLGLETKQESADPFETWQAEFN